MNQEHLIASSTQAQAPSTIVNSLRTVLQGHLVICKTTGPDSEVLENHFLPEARGPSRGQTREENLEIWN